jgi:hypothetical protein
MHLKMRKGQRLNDGGAKILFGKGDPDFQRDSSWKAFITEREKLRDQMKGKKKLDLLLQET